MVVDSVGGRTLVAAMAYNAEWVPDKTVIEFCGRHISYAAFWEYTGRVAGQLQAMGVKPGDKVMLHLPNCPEYLVSWFAIARMGAVVVPCSTGFKRDEIRYQIDHAETDHAIVSLEAEDLVRAAGDESRRPVLITCEPGAMEDGAGALNAMLADVASSPPSTTVTPTDLASIMYTSGTTARPKGVLLTHGNLLHMAHNYAAAYHYTRFDRVLHYFPLYHSNGGIATLYPALLRGATLVMMPKFSVSNFVEQINDHEITIAALNATHCKFLLESEPTDRDRGHSCYRAHFALELDVDRRAAFEARFGIQLVELYGLTEATPIACTPVDSLWAIGCGPPTPGYSIRIVDDDANDVENGVLGEIIVASHSPHGISPGYFKEVAETAATRRDGWLFTGDMGIVDDSGYLHFVQRKKDMIKRSGYNVGAAEVERALTEHPSVKEAAVVGIPDAVKEEAIVGYVVLESDSDPIDEAALLAHCAELLADYKLPQVVTVVDALPETFIGKLDKKALRADAVERFGATFARAGAPDRSPLAAGASARSTDGTPS